MVEASAPPPVHCGEDANARDAEMSVPGAGRHPWAVREAAGAGRESASPVLSAGAPAGLGGREESQAQARGVADSLGRKQWVPGARDSCG